MSSPQKLSDTEPALVKHLCHLFIKLKFLVLNFCVLLKGLPESMLA